MLTQGRKERYPLPNNPDQGARHLPPNNPDQGAPHPITQKQKGESLDRNIKYQMAKIKTLAWKVKLNRK